MICSTICGQAAGARVGGPYSATQIRTSVPFAVPEPPGPEGTPPNFDVVDYDVGPAITPDLDNDVLLINQDGFYYVTVSESWQATDDGDMELVLFINDIATATATGRIQVSRQSGQLTFKDGTISRLFQLAAGDVVRVGVSFAPLDAGTAAVMVSLAAERRN
jgi:hypothetical protein